jgi:hypothetical protein
LAEASAEQDGREIVLSSDRTLQPRPSPSGYHIVERFLRGFAEMRQRERLQGSRARSIRRALPIYMIENIADSADRTPAHLGDTNSAEPVHKNAWFAGFVIKADTAFDKLIVALDDACAHARRGSGGAEIQDSAKSDRQFELRAASFDRRTAGRKHV